MPAERRVYIVGDNGDPISETNPFPVVDSPSAKNDFNLQVSLGNVSGVKGVNKFGRAVAGIQTSETDVWDRADASATQSVWLAPTAARIHQITSTSTSDTSGGVGTQQVQVYGLQTWSSKESSEVVVMDGTNDVATANSYVIIHRMKCILWGASGPNVGTITATADTDSTVTAQINAGGLQGQTQMAIYGIPDSQTMHVKSFYATVNKAQAQAVAANFSLVLNPIPDTVTTGFQVKNTRGLQSTGASSQQWEFEPYPAFAGPCILKLSANANSNDVEASGGFNLYITDN